MNLSNLRKRINAMTAYTIPHEPNTKKAPFQPIIGTRKPPKIKPNPEPQLNIDNKVVNVSPLSAFKKYDDVPANTAAAGKATPDANPNNNLLMSNIENGEKNPTNPHLLNQSKTGNNNTAKDQKKSAMNNRFAGDIDRFPSEGVDK